MRDQIQEKHIQYTIDYFKKYHHGYADISMRYGKTKYTIEVLKALLPDGAEILICYPDSLLKKSWKDECIKWNYNNTNITYVNFRSIHKWSNSIFNFVIIDEFHKASKSQREILKKIITPTKALALSGTVSILTKNLWKLPLIVQYSIDEAIKDEIVSDYKITVHLASLDTIIKTPNSKGKLLTEKQKFDNYSYVISKFLSEGKNAKHLILTRNRLSISSIGKQKKLTEVLNSLKDKRVIIFCGLKKIAESIGLPYYHSDSEDTQSLDDFQSKKINQLALVNTGKIGVTYTDLDCVILYNFVGDSSNNSQALTRALQLDYKNKIADLRIICLNEENERKKLKEGLQLLNKEKIKYI